MWMLMHQNKKPRASVRKYLHPLKKHLHLRKEFLSWHIMQIWFHFSFKVSKKAPHKNNGGRKAILFHY
jgi:hypothetical protein